jgi:hypothetical protein
METSFENQPAEQPNQPIEQAPPPPMELSLESQAHLRETKQWANFLSILMFIYVGFIILGAFLAAAFTSSNDVFNDFPSIFISVFYLIVAILIFFPSLFLFKFADYMGKALNDRNPVDLNASFRNLRSYYRFMGILTIVMLSLMIFAFVFMGTVGRAILD